MPPTPLLRAFFKAPAWLYRAGVGRLLGTRFLVVTHRGRISGRTYDTVLEVIGFDQDRNESTVVSAYGTSADWFRNIAANPAGRVRTGGMDYVPQHRVLTAPERQVAAAAFCARHRWEASMVARVLPAIGADVDRGATVDPITLLAGLPMVAFRPAD